MLYKQLPTGEQPLQMVVYICQCYPSNTDSLLASVGIAAVWRGIPRASRVQGLAGLGGGKDDSHGSLPLTSRLASPKMIQLARGESGLFKPARLKIQGNCFSVSWITCLSRKPTGASLAETLIFSWHLTTHSDLERLELALKLLCLSLGTNVSLFTPGTSQVYSNHLWPVVTLLDCLDTVCFCPLVTLWDPYGV